MTKLGGLLICCVVITLVVLLSVLEKMNTRSFSASMSTQETLPLSLPDLPRSTMEQTEYSPAFDQAFEELMVLEGHDTVVRNPNDRGGVTKFGLSSKTYPHLNIPELTEKDAKDLYWYEWWNQYGYSQLPAKIAKRVFHNTVWMGPSQSHKILQRALRCSGQYTKDDGVIGTHTLQMVSRFNSQNDCLLKAISSETAAVVRLILSTRPNQQVFAAGWLNRAYGDTNGA